MSIKAYQQKCFREYKAQIQYPRSYTYLYGTPINVLVPIETALNKVMIVGAYPSAKFYSVKSKEGKFVNDTPLADNDSPFSNESYFDGTRVRTIPSGKELNEVILSRIGVDRQDCWITDLVKVFLFKEGHIRRYNELGKFDVMANRNLFDTYADKSKEWLQDEMEICNPYIIILLGLEVSKAVLGLTAEKSKAALDGRVMKRDVRGNERSFICLPHPGILMKRTEKNPWPSLFEDEISVTARREIARLREEQARQNGI